MGNLNKAEALKILRELQALGGNPSFTSLDETETGSYELHYKPTVLGLDTLRSVAEKHNLKIRIEEGTAIFS